MGAIKNVLIVDADEQLQVILTSGFIGADYNPVSAVTGTEAEFKLGNEIFDLMVVDLSVTKASWAELSPVLVKAIKKNKTFLLITGGKLSDSEREEISKIPGARFTPKPLQLREFLTLAKKMMYDRELTMSGGAMPASVPGSASKAFDVRIINPFIVAASHVISSAFGGTVDVQKPYLRKGEEVSGDISAVMGLISENFKGNVALSFPERSYLKIISKQFGMEFTELNEDARDAIAEFVKIVTDEVKVELDKNSLTVSMTNPSVIIGPSHSVKHNSKMPPVVVVFKRGDDAFRMEICATAS